MATTTPPRRRVSREAILDAAADRFNAYGFSRTSMEDIARAAGISRAAIYLQFQNKEDIYRANTERVHEALGAAALEAIRSDRPVGERLEMVLRAKLDIWRYFLEKPHGSELLDGESRLAGDISRRGRRRYVSLLKRLLDEAGERGEIDLERAGLSSRALAELIDQWVQGIKQEPELSARAYERRVGDAARMFVASVTT